MTKYVISFESPGFEVSTASDQPLKILRWTIHLGNSNFAVRGACNMAIDLPVTQFVDASVTLVDEFGNPAKFQVGSGVWTASDPTRIELRNVTDDGSVASARIWPLGPTGNDAVRVSFDCDTDPNAPGNQPLATAGFLDVTLLSGVGVTATITPGVPTPKP